MHKILIIDDEQDICEILQFNLETEGYDVEVAYSAEEALTLPLHTYDLILLDVMMGEISGFQFVKRIRANPLLQETPVIFITALDSEDDIVKGLNLGADDYMPKPLSMREVKARVKAVLRRQTHSAAPKQPSTADSADILHESMRINTEMKMLTINGNEVTLTKIEFELLHPLMSNPSKVYSREQILDRICPKDTIVMGRTVNVAITRLRKKIGEYGKCIKTRFGYGYSFEK